MNTTWWRMGAWLVFPPLLTGLPCVASAVEGVQWPLEGVLTSDFGLRHGRPHQGIDVAAPVGTPICTVLPGRVVFAGERGDYGRLVEVAHGGGWTSRYAHLDVLEVDVGDVLDNGDVLGTVGTTGNATGPHLHLELRLHGRPVDPFEQLPW